MTTAAAAERARERIQQFGDEHPAALRLARYASLAVRVDAALLRALRLELLPGSDAGVEADLWFSTLTESVSSQGFVIDEDVVAQLRQELAAERVDDQQRALAAAARITQQAHQHWPESLRLEERATALALRTSPAAGTPIAPEDDLETMLRGLVKAMTESPSRGMEVSRWAQRALPRLPKAARETEAALLLALGAAERLGTSIQISDADRPVRLPDAASWVLPSGSFSRWTSIALRRFDEGLEFAAPEGTATELRLPSTSPLFLEISWRIGRQRSAQTVSVTAGRSVAIPREAREIRLKSLAGEEFALDSVEAIGTEAPDMADSDVDLPRDAVVEVRFDDSPRSIRVSGFFVSSDTVLSLAWEKDLGMPGSTCEVTLGDGRFISTVLAKHATLGALLVRLPRPASNAVVLRRRPDFHASSSNLDRRWESRQGGGAERIDGEFAGFDDQWVSPGGARESMFHLVHGDFAYPEPWLGAPIVVDQEIVGQIVAVSPPLARPIAALEAFISESLRPAEHDPLVFVSYAPRDEYGKGIETDDAQVDRVTAALRAARLNPYLDASIHDRDELTRALNASDGGVLLMTPVSHLDTTIGREELLALAYRRWAQPGFPIAAYRFRQDGVPRPMPSILLRGITTIDLDRTSDDDLREHARRTFTSAGRVPDESAGLDDARGRLYGLAMRAPSSSPPLSGESLVARANQFADDVMDEGIESISALGFSPAENREAIDLAATFSFPASASEPLRPVVHGSKDRRAFALNAMPLQVARAVIRRAWLGTMPPASIVFRDQSPPTPEDVRARVCDEVSKALPCSNDEARFLVNQIDATILVILMMRPIPSASYVEHLLEVLPSAVFVFLVGSDGSNKGAEELVTELRLPPGADMEFFTRYKHLIQTFAPRQSEQPEASRPLTSKKAASRKPATAAIEPGTFFISTSSADARMSARIAQAFETAGLSVWRDTSSLPVGTLWRAELNDAIRHSRAVVLVWSRAAAGSRWVSFEVLTAFHRDRLILPCLTDDTPLPPFLGQAQYLDLRVAGDEALRRLVTLAANAPAHYNPVRPPGRPQSAELNRTVTQLSQLQEHVLRLLTERDLAAARAAQRGLDQEMAHAQRRWPSDVRIRALAGYHRKNAYMLKHWAAIQAGHTPTDPLLLEAERLFLDAAFVDPQDVSVLNGLATVLTYQRELDAAAFFAERAVELAKGANISYEAAAHDRELMDKVRRQPVRKRSVPQSSKAVPPPVRSITSRKTAAKASRKQAPKKK